MNLNENSPNTELPQLRDVMTTEMQSLYRYACYRLGDRDVARDVIQELYLKLHSLRPSHIRNMRCYIYRALSNGCTQYLRKQRRHRFVDISTLNDLRAEELNPTDYEQEQRLIGRLLASISDEQSEVIRLHLHGECTFTEIAEILELPLATVKSRYRYGIEHLRKELQKQNLI